MSNTMKLTIDGMHCGACVRRVTNALEAVAGVQVSSVEIGSAIIACDTAEASPEQIVAAVDRIGFTAHIER